ncbi:MAG: asparagine synthase C-terminal domain-containing protein, partial [Sediminibacterium sp.]|nr:asparagine synthase C-terminal domain-containing protein [Sediminibacterium sp.]
FEIKQTPFSALDLTTHYNYKNYDEFKEFIHAKLKDSFKKRLIADVPISVLLSGGLDSSLVTAFYAKEKVDFTTFTIGFEDKKYDESMYAKKIANYLGIPNNTFICNEQDFINKLKILPDAFDEPFGDSSAIPTLLVAEYIHKNGYKIALSSDGGDEIFGGYSRYLFALKLKRYAPFLNKINPNNHTILQIKTPNGKSRTLYDISTHLKDNDLYTYLLHATKQIDLNNIAINPIQFNEYHFKKKLGFISNMCKTDVDSYLSEDILTKVDRSMMYYGVEGREPFLDKQILECMLQAPDKFKIHNNKGKVILRDILSSYIPPALYDRPKMGFGIPLQKWVNGMLREEIMDIFNNNNFLSDINIQK